MIIQQHPSPNYNHRRTPIRLLIVHYTNMASSAAALARLCDPKAEASAHYLIDEQGDIFQLVDEKHRAWHAGQAYWRGETDINSASIGVELHHTGHHTGYQSGAMLPYPDVQMAAFVVLATDIIARHHIRPSHVLGHSDVAPYRKTDPGAAFDWQLCAAQGIGLWHDEAQDDNRPTLQGGDSGAAVLHLQTALADYGYDVVCDGVYGARMTQLVAAFQCHFRSACVDGIADAQTQARLYRLVHLDGVRATR